MYALIVGIAPPPPPPQIYLVFIVHAMYYVYSDCRHDKTVGDMKQELAVINAVSAVLIVLMGNTH